jgi:hypothetical protein
MRRWDTGLEIRAPLITLLDSFYDGPSGAEEDNRRAGREDPGDLLHGLPAIP